MLPVIHIKNKEVITWVTEEEFEVFKVIHHDFIEFKIRNNRYRIYYDEEESNPYKIQYADWFKGEIMIIQVIDEKLVAPIEPQIIPQLLNHLQVLNDDLKT